MNVHFFRHGAAISNDPRLTEAEIAEERFLDAPPSDHGREQARLAGKELAHALHAATVDVVLVSPLCRALETAELILSSAGISPRAGASASDGVAEGGARRQALRRAPPALRRRRPLPLLRFFSG